MFSHENIRPYVYCILKEAGFHTVDLSATESLTEMLQSLILEIGKTTRTFCEAAGRAQPLPCDVILALIDLGLQINGMEEYTFRPRRQFLPAPIQSAPSKQLPLLAAGLKQQHPQYISNHLPQFPDPHAYTRTPTHKKPVTEYEAIREKAASQKRDLERALNKFKTRTNDTESLFFSGENDAFPLIAVKCQSRTYLTALLPKDQVYDEDDENVTTPTKKSKREKEMMSVVDEEDDDDDDEDENNSKCEPEVIDNPYLRPVKVCSQWNSSQHNVPYRS